MKRIILCADDYGQNKAISQAIIDLLAKKRLTAVSCLVTGKLWLAHATLLKPHYNQADIGLHFNLTHEKSYSLPNLLARSYLRLISREMIVSELNTQLDLFIEGVGKPPDFIDGHQHIHQFPVIKDALFDVYEKRGLKCYVRCTYNASVFKAFNQNSFLKKLFIQYVLTNSFKMQLTQRNIPHNSSFSGIYDFSNVSYEDLFRNFLTQIEDMGMIMCHPAYDDLSSERDALNNARFQEWSYFANERFKSDCKARNIFLTRFSNNRK
jgi:predicted glycoside hydrolase/deacetylase ChbG (UPF0249 family)